MELWVSATRFVARRKRARAGRHPASHAELARAAFITISRMDAPARSEIHPSAGWRGRIASENRDSCVRKPRVEVSARSGDEARADGSLGFQERDGVRGDSFRSIERTRTITSNTISFLKSQATICPRF